MAEADLLQSNNPYRLRDTGQGLNRYAPGLGFSLRATLPPLVLEQAAAV